MHCQGQGLRSPPLAAVAKPRQKGAPQQGVQLHDREAATWPYGSPRATGPCKAIGPGSRLSGQLPHNPPSACSAWSNVLVYLCTLRMHRKSVTGTETPALTSKVAAEHIPCRRPLLLQLCRLARQPKQRAKVLHQHHVHHAAKARKVGSNLRVEPKGGVQYCAASEGREALWGSIKHGLL